MRIGVKAAAVFGSVLTLSLAGGPATAGDAVAGWRWQAESTEINPEGLFWNDFLADGQDRWKSGGVTQSFTLPERVFDTQPWTPWLDGRASGIELSARGLVITPDNTAAAGYNPNDRPYAQYLGLGLYLRSDARPRPAPRGTTLEVEDRVGAEIGWIGEPLFLFDTQDQLHEMLGMDPTNVSDENSVENKILLNLQARRTWRFHRDTGPADVEWAPYLDGSAGLRENSLRAGANIFIGNELAGRSWNMDPAIGAVIPGARPPREGVDWAFFLGGDVGYVASDALLGGGPFASGPQIDPEPLVARARAGVVVGYGRLSVTYGLNWLSPEFEGQGAGQLIGSVAVKLPF